MLCQSIYLIDSVIFTCKAYTNSILDSYVIFKSFCLSIFLFFSLSLSASFFRFSTHNSRFLRAETASPFFSSNIIFVDLHLFIKNRRLKMERGGLLLIPSTRNKRLEIQLAVTVEWRNFFSPFLKYRLLTHIEIIVLLTCYWIHSKSSNDFQFALLRFTMNF